MRCQSITDSNFEIIDYRDYGVFNGKPTITHYNREERRKYIKAHKNIKGLKICPNCKNKTVFITDDNNKSFCELCGKLYPTILFKNSKGEYEPLGVTREIELTEVCKWQKLGNIK